MKLDAIEPHEHHFEHPGTGTRWRCDVLNEYGSRCTAEEIRQEIDTTTCAIGCALCTQNIWLRGTSEFEIMSAELTHWAMRHPLFVLLLPVRWILHYHRSRH